MNNIKQEVLKEAFDKTEEETIVDYNLLIDLTIQKTNDWWIKKGKEFIEEIEEMIVQEWDKDLREQSEMWANQKLHWIRKLEEVKKKNG